MQQYPDIDHTLIEELVRLGYIQDEIETILDALGKNANNAGFGSRDPRRTRFTNAALTALIQRFQDTLNNGQYKALLNVGYTPGEIGDILFTNLLPTAQLLTRTTDAYDSHECKRLCQLGYTDIEIRSLIRAGFTVSQLRAVANRVRDAQRNRRDSQGLTIEQIDDLLFKKRSMNNVQTLGVVRALLSGITSKVREGEIARCIIDFVTMFDVPYGLGGTHGQVDVGTQNIIIEVKIDSVGAKQRKQIYNFLSSDIVNPPDANGTRKRVILYAPGYSDTAIISMQAVGAYVVKSCEELHRHIRQQGGP